MFAFGKDGKKELEYCLDVTFNYRHISDVRILLKWFITLSLSKGYIFTMVTYST